MRTESFAPLRWSQDQEDVVHEVITVLCKPHKLRTWLDKQDRGEGAPFCHWVAPVAVNCLNDWIRGRDDPPQTPPDFDCCDGRDAASGLREKEELAKKLRETIRAVLFEFPWESQLVFCMRWSYLEPTIADIERAADRKERTVFYRLDKIYERIKCQYAEPISPDLAKIVLVCARHPVAGYDRLPESDQAALNQSINRFLAARPLKEQFAFYATCSPLALEAAAIANQVDEGKETVEGWLRALTEQIAHLRQTT